MIVDDRHLLSMIVIQVFRSLVFEKEIRIVELFHFLDLKLIILIS